LLNAVQTPDAEVHASPHLAIRVPSPAALLGSQGAVLCIDDDATNLLVRKAVLQSVGYSVLTATTGREGLNLFQHCSVAAVIVDFQMPEMNGAQVAAEMKRMRPHVPIIMLSAHTVLTPDLLRSTDAYLIKGNNLSTLFEVLAKLTSHPSATSQAGTGRSKLV
jgi:CheY-like chemotaxis protein